VEGWSQRPDEANQFYNALSDDNRIALDTRALAVVRAVVPLADELETITWIKPIPQDVDEATLSWYIDGSTLDGPTNTLRRSGAGFLATNPEGDLVAYGFGVPPWWVDTTPGAEAWALGIVVSATTGRKHVFTDCLGNVSTIQRGSAWATAANRRYARIWGPTFSALDGLSNDSRWLIWLPAHTAKKQIGVALRSDGIHITPLDHKANWLVDELAKYAANIARLPKYVRQLFSSAAVAVEHSAALVGVQCKAANNCEVEVLQDNGEMAKIILRDSTPLSIAARHAVSHEQRRQRAADISAAALAKIQHVFDRDSEARECRSMAREEAFTRLNKHRATAAFLCGVGLDSGNRTAVMGGTSGAPAAALVKLATHEAVVTTRFTPQAATRKRAARDNNEAQRANVAKQNARRGAILRANTAARKCGDGVQTDVHAAGRAQRRRATVATSSQTPVSDTAGSTGTVDPAATRTVEPDESRIVGAVADWWSRKRKPPASSTGSEVKRFRLNSKTREA
jgi:hypothetical protein